MLKSIRVILSQQMPNYRKPASFLVKESYPLPPYSSVIGMIHAACGFEKYHDMQISIQGESASEISDLATMYNFGIAYDMTRHQASVLNDKGNYDGINIGPKSVHLLTDVKLVLHIVPNEQEDFESIYNGLINPQYYLSLGRYEDIVRIDDVKLLDLEEFDFEDEAETLKFDAYIPLDNLDNDAIGTIYKLTKKFSVDKKTNQRNWDQVVKVRHVSKNQAYSFKNSFLDAELRTPVSFA